MPTTPLLILLLTVATYAQTSLYDKRDGKTYKTVQIGTQIWMAENLNYATKSSMCYNKNQANCDIYGRLYSWKEAKKVCPKGWHLPSDEEFETLAKFAGNRFVAGKKLKAKNGWEDSGNGTDEYGFSALPGGICYEPGNCHNAGRNGSWWSATRLRTNYIENRDLYYNKDNFFSTGGDNEDLLSVRCLSD